MAYFIGLPQWQHADWYPAEIKSPQALQHYAQHFSSIEGNSTFYGLPKAVSIQRWNAEVSDEFRFCFKFPKSISHDAKLQHCWRELEQFFQRIEPLQEKIGILWLQMNQYFKPEELGKLAQFLQHLPEGFNYGIEVRHLGFFDKAEQERAFNRLLLEKSINRVMFDTRLLFQHPASDNASQDALHKKPCVPLHVLATSNTPMVRFISPVDLDLAEIALNQWAQKIIQWIEAGKTPYIFFHTPSNQQSPQLAKRFAEKVSQLRPDITALQLWSQQAPTKAQIAPQQTDLF
jgi:uncharacterized protein YecE (DUF72 family)